MDKTGYVYILTNQYNNVIYIGVTSDLKKRVWEHKNDLVVGFTKTYKVHKLVYYEVFTSMIEAITREKQLKAGSRKKKMQLITNFNPKFEDLYDKV